MPVSHSENKEWMLDRYVELKPEVTVDIGPGAGTYADLMRTSHRGEWKAVEAWAPYIPKYDLWKKYDHVIVSDFRHADFFSIHHGPDLVIIGDCLEHIPKDEAIYHMSRLKAWASAILVSVPLGNSPQGEVDGNWFEIHRSTWSFKDMEDLLSDGLASSHRGKVVGSFLWKM